MDRFSLDTRVALVTGAGSGIGRATSLELARAGARVVAADSDLPATVETVELICGDGGRALAVEADVTDVSAVDTMVDAAVTEFGSLDIAVNCAGMTSPPLGILGTTPEDWRRLIAVNLTSVFLCMRAEVPHMLEAGRGSIVNIASGAGLVGANLLPAYTASKHGVVGLTKSVALELAPRGVRVNCICPGATRTPMLEGFLSGNELMEQLMVSGHPIGRLGTPEEIADAVRWVCSDAASFVVGAAITIDGGAIAQ